MRRSSSLALDQRGSTIVEFALIAPVFFLLLLGLFDVGHTLYMKGVVEGALQKAARDSTLETNTTEERLNALDDIVRQQVMTLGVTRDQISFRRRFYRTFSDAAAAKAEDWTDTNRNGICDRGEPYEDANQNNIWDADGGDAGQGGAKDATVVTVIVKYPHMFPLLGLLGKEAEDVRIVSRTVLKNQPYSDQGSYSRPVRKNCT